MKQEGASAIPPEYGELTRRMQERFGLTDDEFGVLELLAQEPFQREVTFKRVAGQMNIQPRSVVNFASRLRLKLHEKGVLSPAYNDTESFILYYQEARKSIR